MPSPSIILFATVLVDLIGFAIIVPLLSLYAETFGASGSEIGLLVSSFALARLSFSPIVGSLSDRVGRRPIIVTTLFISATAHLIFALAPSLAVLFIGRIIAGIGASNIPVASAYIADTTDLKHRTRSMGLISAAYNIGFVLGPAIGGVLSFAGFIFPILFASILSFSAAILALILLPESLRSESKTRKRIFTFDVNGYLQQISRYRLGLLVTTNFLFNLTVTSLVITIPLFSSRVFGLGTFEVGMLFALTGVFGSLSQLVLVNKLSLRIAEHLILALGAVISILGILFIIWSDGFVTLAGAVSLLSMGVFLAYPIVRSMVSKRVPADRQGSVLGLSEGIGSFATITGPLMMGLILDTIEITASFVALVVVMLIALVSSLGIGRKPHHENPL